MAQFTGTNWDNLMSAHTARWGRDEIRMESDESFLLLKNLLGKKLSVHWYYSYLEKYITEGIIPFGLRLKLFPHFQNPSAEFKLNWEKALTSCSLVLMQLLVDEHKKEIEQLDNDIQTCNSTIAASELTVALAEKEKELNLGLEKISHDILTKKEKKLTRDPKAFTTNKAYIWPSTIQPSHPRPYRRFNKPNPRNEKIEVDYEQENSESSVSSASSVNSSLSSRYYKQARKRLKGPDREHSFERKGNQTRTGDVSHEVAGHTIPSNSTSTSVNTSFLENPNTPRPGTIQAHFPKVGGANHGPN